MTGPLELHREPSTTHAPAHRERPHRERPRPSPRPHRGAALVCLALAATAALGGCDLRASATVSASGTADLSLEIGIDDSLIEGEGPSCQDVVEGVLSGIIPLEGVDLEATRIADDTHLRCRASTTLTLGGGAWDGQSGRPLWWSGSESTGDSASDEGDYRLALPLSQGSGSSGVSPQVADSLGISRSDVVLTVTMPAPVTSTTVGEVSGDTVTVTGSDVLLKDLDIRAGGGGEAGRGGWVLAGTLAVGAAGLGVMALVLRRGNRGGVTPRRPGRRRRRQ